MSMPKTPENKPWDELSVSSAGPEIPAPYRLSPSNPAQVEAQLREQMVGLPFGEDSSLRLELRQINSDIKNLFPDEYTKLLDGLLQDSVARTSILNLIYQYTVLGHLDRLQLALLNNRLQSRLGAFLENTTAQPSGSAKDILPNFADKTKTGKSFLFANQVAQAPELTGAQQRFGYLRLVAIILILLGVSTGAVLSPAPRVASAQDTLATPTPAAVALGNNKNTVPDVMTQGIPTPTPAPTAIAESSPSVSPSASEGNPDITSTETITYTLATVLSDANLRSGPGTTNPIVGGVKSGDELQVLGENQDGTWVQIQWEAGDAWIAAFLVEQRELVVSSAGENTGGAVGGEAGGGVGAETGAPAAANEEIAQESTTEQATLAESPLSFSEARAKYPDAINYLENPRAELLFNQFLPENQGLHVGTIDTLPYSIIDGQLSVSIGEERFFWNGDNKDAQLRTWYWVQKEVSIPGFSWSIAVTINPDVPGLPDGTGLNINPERSKELQFFYAKTLRDSSELIGLVSNSPDNLRRTTSAQSLGHYIEGLDPEGYQKMLDWFQGAGSGLLSKPGEPFSDAVDTESRLGAWLSIIQEYAPEVKSISVCLSRLPSEQGFYSPTQDIAPVNGMPSQHFSITNGNIVIYLANPKPSNTALINAANMAITHAIQSELIHSTLPSESIVTQPDNDTQLAALVILSALAYVQGTIDEVNGIFAMFMVDKG